MRSCLVLGDSGGGFPRDDYEGGGIVTMESVRVVIEHDIVYMIEILSSNPSVVDP